MGKDPAVLFYTADFLTDTMLLTDEQTGKYIRLLCLQHQRGHLTEKEMVKVCSKRDDDIFGFFTKDEQGRYFNEALDAEISRRREYAESRKKNRASKKEAEMCGAPPEHMPDTGETCDGHMETETETEAETKTAAKGRRFVPPTREEVEAYCAKAGARVDAQRFVDFYASKGWMVGKTPMKDWQAAVRGWEGRAKAEQGSERPQYDVQAYRYGMVI